MRNAERRLIFAARRGALSIAVSIETKEIIIAIRAALNGRADRCQLSDRILAHALTFSPFYTLACEGYEMQAGILLSFPLLSSVPRFSREQVNVRSSPIISHSNGIPAR